MRVDEDEVENTQERGARDHGQVRQGHGQAASVYVQPRQPQSESKSTDGRVPIVEAMGLCSPEPAGPNVLLGKRRVSRSTTGPQGLGRAETGQGADPLRSKRIPVRVRNQAGETLPVREFGAQVCAALDHRGWRNTAQTRGRPWVSRASTSRAKAESTPVQCTGEQRCWGVGVGGQGLGVPALPSSN